MSLRVALAEDSYIVREGLEQLLCNDEEIEVLASCADMPSLLAAVEADPPDVVLTDIRMPPDGDDAGIQIAARLRETNPEIGVVVLSQYSEPGFVLRLLDSGSEGRAYLLKERIADRSELTRAIRAVAEGGSVIDPKIVEVLVQARSRGASSPLAEMTRLLQGIPDESSPPLLPHVGAEPDPAHGDDGDAVAAKSQAASLGLSARRLHDQHHPRLGDRVRTGWLWGR